MLSVTVSVSILSSKLGAVTVSVSILSSKLEAGLSLGGAFAYCVWAMVVSVLWARAMWLEKAMATVRPNFSQISPKARNVRTVMIGARLLSVSRCH